MSPELQQLLDQVMPWGMTVAQTLIVIGAFLGLLLVLWIFRFVARVSAAIMQVGCFLILVCVGLIVAYFFLVNNGIIAPINLQ